MGWASPGTWPSSAPASYLSRRVVGVVALAQGFLDEGLVLVVAPQLADQVGQQDVVGVLGHQAQHEDAVVAQVLVGKLLGELLVLRALDLVQDAQVLLDVGHSAKAEEGAPQPEEEVAGGEDGHDAVPEPQEDEDLLVEEVDGQHALHCVALDVLQLADVEVAERDLGEARRLSPRVVPDQAVEDLKAVQVVPSAHEAVEDEELADDVGDVEHLDEDVEAGEVGAVPLGAQEADEPGDALTHADEGVEVVLAVGLQPAVHVLGDVHDRLLPLLARSDLRGHGHGDDLVQVEGGAAVEHPPDEAGELKHQSHEHENDGHPLVVGQLLGVPARVLRGDGVAHRDVVSVLHPAVRFRIRYEGAREVGGRPALDGVAHILTARDEDGEDDEEDDGV